MLEDFAMEKKSSGRTVQVPPKGISTELKKNQDLPGASKPGTRTARRREPNPSRNDGRKANSQKYKHPDKRPRSKGQFPISGKEDTKVEEDTVAQSGKQKQNLNHLLNFHYAPREGGVPTHSNWRQGHTGWGRRSIATYKHKYNKEQYLQANCQFIVRDTNDYVEYMANPDLLVDWNYIEQIIFWTTENVSCPICLYPPSAAKISRCGHIFCYSCVLHYLALSDKHCRKCPICFVFMERSDLKSVVVMKQKQYAVGDEITLRLMKRARGCLIPMPVDETGYPLQNRLLSVSEKEMNTSYSKLLLATAHEVLEIIAQERSELQSQFISEMDCPEQCFTEQALELLKEREQPLKESLMTRPSFTGVRVPVIPTPKVDNTSVHPSLRIEEQGLPSRGYIGDTREIPKGEKSMGVLDFQRTRFESFSSEGLSSEDGICSLSTGALESHSATYSGSMASSTAPKYYFFYQAADGQHIYMHSVNVHMLEHQFGNLEHCPRTLKGRILEKESGSMTEELRHRLRYLQHLPVTCQFDLVEIQLKPPVISKNTLEFFQDQLEARKRRRQQRARDERRREKRINEAEKRRMGQYPSPRLSLQSDSQFPLCGTEMDCSGIGPLTLSSQTAPHDLLENPIVANVCGLSLEEARAPVTEGIAESACGPSFAQMLREGKGRSHDLASSKIDKTTPNKAQIQRCYSSEDEDICEDYIPAPAPGNQQFLSEAISKAMEKKAEVKHSAPDGSNGKKKKKQKQKILFSSGIAFTSKE